MNYQRIHDAIINKAKLENRKKIKNGIYYEKHHIIPKCLGGDNSKDNLVLLRAKEHFLIHLLLAHIHNNKKLWCAVLIMCHKSHSNWQRKSINGKTYEFIKTRIAESQNYRKHSIETKQKMSNSRKGKPMPEEVKLKISASKKGLPLHENIRKGQKIKITGSKISQKHKEAISKANKNKILSEETKLKMSKSKKGLGLGRITSEETKQKLKKPKSKEFKENLKLYYKNNKEKCLLNLKKANLSLNKKILQLDFNNNLIKEYNSITEAAKELNVSNTSISNALRGKSKSCKSFKWEYKN